MQKLSCLHERCVELTSRSNLLLLDGTARNLAWVKEIYWNGGKPSDLPYRDIWDCIYVREHFQYRNRYKQLGSGSKASAMDGPRDTPADSICSPWGESSLDISVKLLF